MPVTLPMRRMGIVDMITSFCLSLCFSVMAEAMKPDGLTELHIVNGLHPTLPWRY